MKLSGCLSLSDFVKSRPFRKPCTSAANVCMETNIEHTTIRYFHQQQLLLATEKLVD